MVEPERVLPALRGQRAHCTHELALGIAFTTPHAGAHRGGMDLISHNSPLHSRFQPVQSTREPFTASMSELALRGVIAHPVCQEPLSAPALPWPAPASSQTCWVSPPDRGCGCQCAIR